MYPTNFFSKSGHFLLFLLLGISMTSCLAFSREQIRADRENGESRQVEGISDKIDVYGILEKQVQKSIECDTHDNLSRLSIRNVHPSGNHYEFDGKYDGESMSQNQAYRATFTGEADVVDGALKLIYLQFENPYKASAVKRQCLR